MHFPVNGKGRGTNPFGIGIGIQGVQPSGDGKADGRGRVSGKPGGGEFRHKALGPFGRSPRTPVIKAAVVDFVMNARRHQAEMVVLVLHRIFVFIRIRKTGDIEPPVDIDRDDPPSVRGAPVRGIFTVELRFASSLIDHSGRRHRIQLVLPETGITGRTDISAGRSRVVVPIVFAVADIVDMIVSPFHPIVPGRSPRTDDILLLERTDAVGADIPAPTFHWLMYQDAGDGPRPLGYLLAHPGGSVPAPVAVHIEKHIDALPASVIKQVGRTVLGVVVVRSITGIVFRKALVDGIEDGVIFAHIGIAAPLDLKLHIRNPHIGVYHFRRKGRNGDGRCIVVAVIVQGCLRPAVNDQNFRIFRNDERVARGSTLVDERQPGQIDEQFVSPLVDILLGGSKLQTETVGSAVALEIVGPVILRGINIVGIGRLSGLVEQLGFHIKPVHRRAALEILIHIGIVTVSDDNTIEIVMAARTKIAIFQNLASNRSLFAADGGIGIHFCPFQTGLRLDRGIVQVDIDGFHLTPLELLSAQVEHEVADDGGDGERARPGAGKQGHINRGGIVLGGGHGNPGFHAYRSP